MKHVDESKSWVKVMTQCVKHSDNTNWWHNEVTLVDVTKWWDNVMTHNDETNW